MFASSQVSGRLRPPPPCCCRFTVCCCVAVVCSGEPRFYLPAYGGFCRCGGSRRRCTVEKPVCHRVGATQACRPCQGALSSLAAVYTIRVAVHYSFAADHQTKRRNGAAVMAKARPDVCSAYTTPIVPMMRRKHKSKSRKPRDAGASRAAAGASPPAAPGVSRSPQQAASAPCEHPRMSPVAAVRSLSSTTPPPPTAAHASAEAPAPAPAPTSPAPPDAASRPTTAASAFTTGVDFCLFCGLDDAGCGC